MQSEKRSHVNYIYIVRNDVTCLMGSHSYLPTLTRTRPTEPYSQKDSINILRRDGRLSFPDNWLHTEMVYLSANSHPSKY